MEKTSERGVGEAIRQLLASETKTSSGAAYERELGLYMSASEEKRQVVVERLMALADLPPPKSRTTADILAVAKRLVVEQSNVYRLLTRIREHGPVSGLLPGYRVKRKTGVASDGFGEPVDGWISDALRDRPGVSIPQIGKLLADKATLRSARDPESRVDLPGPTSLRRRVQALRAQGAIGGDVMETGGAILIDQCPIDLVIPERRDDGGTTASHRVVMTAVLDVRSNLMLGVGVCAEGNPLEGLSAALTDLRTRVPALAADGIGFVRQPSRIKWIVPAVLLAFVAEVENSAVLVEPDIDLDLTITDDAWTGLELQRHLGGRIGPFELIARVRQEAVARDEVGARTPREELLTLTAAETALTFAAAERNRHRVEAVTEDERRSGERHEAEAVDFVETMDFLFENVIVPGRGT